MDRAVARLEQALARGERIAIHGDYDVDGITSTVILRRALELLGGEVVHFIPERLRDGYGLQPAAIERLHADGVAADRVGRLRHPRGGGGAARPRSRRRPDHHGPPRARGTLPRALAVINPKRHDCTYPDKHLAGVGVALKLVQALCAQGGAEQVAAGASSRSPPSARLPTSSRSSARTASSRASALRRSRAARTRSVCGRCSRRRDSRARRSTATRSRSCSRRASTPPAA